MARSRFTLAVGAVLAGLTAAHAAQAVTISYSAAVSTPYQPGAGNTKTLTLSQFDPSLGTLVSVTFSLLGSITGTTRVENTGDGQTTVTENLGATLTLTRSDDPSTTLAAALPLASITDTDLPSYDGNLDYSGNSGRTHTGLNGSNTDTRTKTASDTSLTPYIGTGNIVLTLTSAGNNSVSGDTTDVYYGFSSRVTAGATVTYNYVVPTVVPEPASLALLGAGLIGCSILRRKSA